MADQQANYLATKIFNDDQMEVEGSPEFRYLHKDSMAQIGAGQAVMDVSGDDCELSAGNLGWELYPKG